MLSAKEGGPTIVPNGTWSKKCKVIQLQHRIYIMDSVNLENYA